MVCEAWITCVCPPSFGCVVDALSCCLALTSQTHTCTWHNRAVVRPPPSPLKWLQTWISTCVLDRDVRTHSPLTPTYRCALEAATTLLSPSSESNSLPEHADLSSEVGWGHVPCLFCSWSAVARCTFRDVCISTGEWVCVRAVWCMRERLNVWRKYG